MNITFMTFTTFNRLSRPFHYKSQQ